MIRFAPVFAAVALAFLVGGTAAAAPPFGFWRTPAAEFGKGYGNAAAIAFSTRSDTPQTVITTLNAARAAHMHVIIAFGDAHFQATQAGTFSLDGWKRGIATWCQPGHCLNLAPYVADGTVLGIHLFEKSKAETTQRGPSLPEIKAAAAYVKTFWPSLRTFVDSSRPCILADETWSRHDLDGVMIEIHSERRGDNWQYGKILIDRGIECARQQGLAYTLDINPLGATQNGLSETSLPTFRALLEYMLLPHGQVATLIWRWFPNNTNTVSNGNKQFANFWNENENPGVSDAMREIYRCAGSPSATTCPNALR